MLPLSILVKKIFHFLILRLLIMFKAISTNLMLMKYCLVN